MSAEEMAVCAIRTDIKARIGFDPFLWKNVIDAWPIASKSGVWVFESHLIRPCGDDQTQFGCHDLRAIDLLTGRCVGREIIDTLSWGNAEIGIQDGAL